MKSRGRIRLLIAAALTFMGGVIYAQWPRRPLPADARARGVGPGGLIMVHGVRNGLGFVGRLHRLFDWTDGCIAVTDWEIDEIWRIVADGTPIEIEA